MSGPETLKSFFPHAFLWVLKMEFAKSIFFRVGLARIHTGPPIKADITLSGKCQNRSRISVFLPWCPTLHTKAHTKSNFSRTPAMFKEPLKLKSYWKVSASQKKKESSTNLVHVIILHNAIKHLSQPKSYELALFYGKAKWRLFNTATTPCDSFAPIFAVPFAVCTFGGFGEIAFSSYHKQARRFATTSKYFM